MERTGTKLKVVANEIYLPVIRELLEEGKEVPLTVSGSSMAPFIIHQRDQVLLAPVDTKLHKGDIAIFQRENGQYVLHRICRAADGEEYFFIGDAQTQVEGPVERSRIFGRVKAVCRKGRWIRPGDFWWEFFEHVWLHMIPVRRPVSRIYAVLRRNRGISGTGKGF